MTSLLSKRVLVEREKEDLSPQEFICAIWALRALLYDLVEDPMFKHHFGLGIPKGFVRHELSTTMKTFAVRINETMYKRMGGEVVTLGIDGWTNFRHRYVMLCFVMLRYDVCSM